MTTTRVAIVTGSSSGIGASTARLYASHGWNVAVNYSRNAEPAEAVAAECRALGVDVRVIRADVASDEDCRRLAAEVDAAWGRIDVLVNNAGTTKFVDLKNLDGLNADDFHAIYDVNVIGTFQMTRAVAPIMKRTGGGVVNISSVASMMGRGSSIAYMASKGAVNAMTVGLARALSPEIRVNAIAPGFVETPWLRAGLGDAGYDVGAKAYADRAALNAVIQPDDVADAAWWLGAGAAKTTGEVILLDAGLRIGRA